MKFCIILLIGVCASCEGLFGSSSLQDYIDNFVDTAQFQLEGILSLNDSSINRIWSYFKSKYDRVYTTVEEEKERLRIFRDHLQYVLQTNLRKFHTFQLELNEFADWTSEEFDELKKGLIVSTTLKREIQDHLHIRRNFHGDKRFFRDWFYSIFGGNKNRNNSNQFGNIFDWRSKNVVSEVKNQRKCGCCYAFATATIMETLYALKTKSTNVMDFSAQQIADCSSNGNNGCKGGSFQPSIRYLSEQGGKIATEASYPYVGKKQTCRTDNLNQIQLGNIEYGSIPEGDEKQMAEALTTYGPLFIGLDAESRRFMFYKSGILKIDNCPTRRQDMDHAMVIVGHGYDSKVQMSYWTIKNSWGTRWGENGYLRLAKDAGNMCGVASMASYGKLT